MLGQKFHRLSSRVLEDVVSFNFSSQFEFNLSPIQFFVIDWQRKVIKRRRRCYGGRRAVALAVVLVFTRSLLTRKMHTQSFHFNQKLSFKSSQNWKSLIYRVPQKKCPIAIFSLNLFQRSDYTFSHVFRNQNSEPVSSKHIKHPSRIWSALKTPKTHAHGTGDPRSPDLNPLDYGSRVCLKQKSIEYSGIWGKSRLFSPRPQTLLQLKVRLDQEIARLAVIEKETQIPK